MKQFKNDINGSIKVLRNGGIILYPTDTIWGIGCDATNSIAVKKIYQLKKREEKKSMIILLARFADIKTFVLHPSRKIIDFLKRQKQPTTAIFNNAINLSPNLINADGSIAIRVIKDNFSTTLLKKLKKPLVSTSANISGQHNPQNFSEINNAIKSGVDYIVQHRQDEIEIQQPSAIIKLNRHGEIEKIR